MLDLRSYQTPPQNDTQLVSILYRTHKSLPAAHKIPSLYIFDALAKSARSVATKTGADTHASKGNASTFLAKMEGVLDGLILDMVNNGTTEARVRNFIRVYLLSAFNPRV